MKVLLVLSVLTCAVVQNTAGNLLEVGGVNPIYDGGYGGVYGGGYGGYGPQYPPVNYPIEPIGVPPVENLLPALCGPGMYGGGMLGGGMGCVGYSIQICPLGGGSLYTPGYNPNNPYPYPYPSPYPYPYPTPDVLPLEHRIAEIIDVKLVDEVTGQILEEEIEEFDVTREFYRNQFSGLGPFVGGMTHGGLGGYYEGGLGGMTPGGLGGYYEGGLGGMTPGGLGGYYEGGLGGMTPGLGGYYEGGYSPYGPGGFNRFPLVPEPHVHGGYGPLGPIGGQIGYGGFGGGIIGGFGSQPPLMPGASRSLDD